MTILNERRNARKGMGESIDLLKERAALWFKMNQSLYKPLQGKYNES